MGSPFACKRARSLSLTLFLSAVPYLSQAQVLMPASGPGGLVRTFSTDAAILEVQEVRKDLPCTVTPSKPALGFDLKFHSGYEVVLPLKDLAGAEELLPVAVGHDARRRHCRSWLRR